MGVGGQLHALAILRLRKIPQNNIASIMSRLWAGQSRFQILRGARDFSLIEIMQIGLDVHPSSYYVGTEIFLLRVRMAMV